MFHFLAHSPLVSRASCMSYILPNIGLCQLISSYSSRHLRRILTLKEKNADFTRMVMTPVERLHSQGAFQPGMPRDWSDRRLKMMSLEAMWNF